MKSCQGCQERDLHCHGRNADGSYRCQHWSEQEKEAERRRKQRVSDGDYSGYLSGVMAANERRINIHKTK